MICSIKNRCMGTWVYIISIMWYTERIMHVVDLLSLSHRDSRFLLPPHLLYLTPPPSMANASSKGLSHPLCTSLCLLCGKHGVFVWTQFSSWFIYSPPFLLWFQRLVAPLGPSVRPAPGLPAKQKQGHQPFWPWNAPPHPPPLALIHCIVAIVLQHE